MTLKSKILIVDDNKHLCSNMKDILEFKGYSVSCVYAGLEAVKAVKEDAFTVVLMDIKMPGMNGIDTLKTLKQIAPELIVIFITALTDDTLYEEGIKSGACEIITKPFDIDKFLGRLEEVIEKKSQ
ncbi:MAG: response regulator [Candidatus Omnitrophica bacterium]|nr:response regulator [Candidatus Omnitrophota bacterium]